MRQIKNKLNGNIEAYEEPIPFKKDGVQGYICVDDTRVFFIWMYGDDLVKDELTTYEVIEDVSRQNLIESIQNLMGLLDTPIGRNKFTGDIADEARKQAREILEKLK